MINYQSSNPIKNFIMIDKELDDKLSSNAYYLLIKLMKLAPNEPNNNNYLMQKIGLSRRSFEKAKKELVNKGFLDTKQLWSNRYAFYIGKESVKKYKYHKKNNNRHEQYELNQFKKESEATKK